MKHKTPLWIVLGFFLSAILAAAQSQPGRGGPNRERLRENLHHLRLLRMTEALDLTEEQTAKIYPYASRIEKEKAAIVRELGAEMAELRQLVEEAQPKDEDLAARVEVIRQLRRRLQEKDLEFEKFLQANLSEIQVARYVIFQADFNRVMGDRLNRARAMMRSGRRP
jgi:predicted RNase H-like nuclease (RuvC/YqgF family)